MDKPIIIKDDSDFSSDEEENSKLREILNDVVVDQMFKSQNDANEHDGPIVISDNDEHKTTINGYLANVLTERLDREIDIVEMESSVPSRISEQPVRRKSQISLFRSCGMVTIGCSQDEDEGEGEEEDEEEEEDDDDEEEDEDDDEDEEEKPRRHRKKRRYRDYESESSEAAVSSDWVCDQSFTSNWEDPKKPRVLKMKLVRKNKDGSMECEPLPAEE